MKFLYFYSCDMTWWLTCRNSFFHQTSLDPTELEIENKGVETFDGKWLIQFKSKPVFHNLAYFNKGFKVVTVRNTLDGKLFDIF